MRVFVTGATGFIGMKVVPELIAAGHQVLGLARSAEKGAAVAALGAELRLGSLEEPERLASYAAEADGVIHLAFNHDFSRMAQNCADDRAVIEALGGALAGSGRVLIMTSGTALAMSVDGQPSTEDGPVMGPENNERGRSETTAFALAERGVNVSAVRLPQVHDPVKQGLITYAIAAARRTGVLAYRDDVPARLPGAHAGDVARLYRLALERGARSARFHAVAEEGIPVRDMFEVIGRRTGLAVKPVSADEMAAQYGFLAHFLTADLASSSAWTRAELGWEPTGPTMLEDLARLEVG